MNHHLELCNISLQISQKIVQTESIKQSYEVATSQLLCISVKQFYLLCSTVVIYTVTVSLYRQPPHAISYMRFGKFLLAQCKLKVCTHRNTILMITTIKLNLEVLMPVVQLLYNLHSKLTYHLEDVQYFSAYCKYAHTE